MCEIADLEEFSKENLCKSYKGLGIKKGPPSKTLIKSEDLNIWQNYFVEVIFRQFRVSLYVF